MGQSRRKPQMFGSAVHSASESPHSDTQLLLSTGWSKFDVPDFRGDLQYPMKSSDRQSWLQSTIERCCVFTLFSAITLLFLDSFGVFPAGSQSWEAVGHGICFPSLSVAQRTDIGHVLWRNYLILATTGAICGLYGSLQRKAVGLQVYAASLLLGIALAVAAMVPAGRRLLPSDLTSIPGAVTIGLCVLLIIVCLLVLLWTWSLIRLLPFAKRSSGAKPVSHYNYYSSVGFGQEGSYSLRAPSRPEPFVTQGTFSYKPSPLVTQRSSTTASSASSHSTALLRGGSTIRTSSQQRQAGTATAAESSVPVANKHLTSAFSSVTSSAPLPPPTATAVTVEGRSSLPSSSSGPIARQVPRGPTDYGRMLSQDVVPTSRVPPRLLHANSLTP